jgi:(1->4)-alpha-D-glucan 1-alpha-D-glucosylmutase
MFLPNSTYRIQLNDQFTLCDLEAIIPYLQKLGISAIYASPLTTAQKGSQHGYDVTNPLVLSPEIGTEEQWQRLSHTLKEYGIGWIQDIVPNHMAYDMSNPWLYDVLQRGKQSMYYGWFDIITDHPIELLGDRLMAPFLGSTLTECLQKEELTLQFTQRGFVIRYFDNDYPVAVRLYRWILTLTEGCPSEVLASLDTLDAAIPAEPGEWKKTIDAWIVTINADPAFRSFIDTRIIFFNQRINLLESLVQNQPYILTYHRLAATHMNYRRFFTVNSLICLNMEKEVVFDAWHQTIHRWYRQGLIHGLRVDHVDGLADPKKYCQRLKQLFGRDCYVVVEKILSQKESLPADWPVEGTTGYDLLADVSQLLTDAEGSRELLVFYRGKVSNLPHIDDLVYQRKHQYLIRNMGGEWDNLLHLLGSFPLLETASQDKTRLKQALGVWMASFPVYRAYPDANGCSPADIEIFTLALQRAKKYQPDLLPELNFLAALYEAPATHSADMAKTAVAEQKLCFLRRLMQFTGPLAAKGIEDTSFYIYNPYIAHCEVGDSPALAGIAPSEFHRRMQVRQSTQRYSLNGTSTHDTKRGEDARIRLNYLSVIPREWTTAVARWGSMNRRHVHDIGGRPAPSSNDEYLIYQALLGAWPDNGIITDSFRERFAGYLTKALREADTETHYNDPDEGYEGQCQAFVTAILTTDSPFLEEFIPFAWSVLRLSSVYSLSQLLLKITAPGVPDIYQGAEAWETSLVDPDNRRPVDFSVRALLLDGLKTAETTSGCGAAMEFARANAVKGAEKIYTLYRGLAVRNQLPLVFAEGDYLPLETEGPLLAFLRRYKKDWVLVAVPLMRYETSFPVRAAITLPADAPVSWSEAFTGQSLSPVNNTLSWPQGLNSWPVVLATAQ